MTRDPHDDLLAKLFQAAHDEPPPRGAVERTVAAAARARGAGPAPTFWQRRWPVLGLAFAVAASLALGWWRSRPPERGADIAAEPTTAAPEKPQPLPHELLPVPKALGSAEVPAAPTPRREGMPSAAPPSGSAPSLGAELDALKRAETALGAGNAQAALDALDRYDHVLHGQQLRAEAALLRMDALSRSGHAEQAAMLAARFVTENPGSPLVDRARSFLAKPPGSRGSAASPPAEVP